MKSHLIDDYNKVKHEVKEKNLLKEADECLGRYERTSLFLLSHHTLHHLQRKRVGKSKCSKNRKTRKE